MNMELFGSSNALYQDEADVILNTRGASTGVSSSKSCGMLLRRLTSLPVSLDSPPVITINSCENRVYTCGRGTWCDVRLVAHDLAYARSLSIMHVILGVEKKESGTFFYVFDKASRTGTFLNSKRLRQNEKVKLSDGDILVFGCPEQYSGRTRFKSEFRFEAISF